MQSFWEWLEECASVWKSISEVFEMSDTSDSVGRELASKPTNYSVVIVTLYRLLGWSLPFYTAGFV